MIRHVTSCISSFDELLYKQALGIVESVLVTSVYYTVSQILLLRCQTFHTANGTQPNFAKREEVNGADASRIR